MARVFAYLMNTRLTNLTDQGIFEDCSNVINQALKDCYSQNSNTKNITNTALELALKKLL